MTGGSASERCFIGGREGHSDDIGFSKSRRALYQTKAEITGLYHRWTGHLYLTRKRNMCKFYICFINSFF